MAKLYEIFVQAQPFADRGVKSLSLKSTKGLAGKNFTPEVKNGIEKAYEVYVIHNLTVSPLAENREALKDQAKVCLITLDLDVENGDDVASFVSGIIDSITSCHFLTACSESDGCKYRLNPSSGLVEEFYGCDCDVVVGTEDDDDKFFMTTVAYKSDGDANDIQMIAIFEVEVEDVFEIEGVTDVLTIPVNSPKVPPIVPRFSTIQELVAFMTEALNQFVGDATGLDFDVTATYQPGTETEPGSFLIDLGFGKAVEQLLSFDASLSIGDLASLTVDPETQLALEAEFSFFTEFGVILEANSEEQIKFVGSLCKGEPNNCEFYDDFRFQLDWEDLDFNNSHPQTDIFLAVATASNDIADAVAALQNAFTGSNLDDKVNITFGKKLLGALYY